jgi:Recombination endonuclease VII
MSRDKQKQLARGKRYRDSAKGKATYKKWREANPTVGKAAHHRRNYGEPYEAKLKRLERQGGCCANPGCRTTDPGTKGWSTDHNHITGEVRGELCQGCNLALGLLKEDELKAEGLALYLRQYR